MLVYALSRPGIIWNNATIVSVGASYYANYPSPLSNNNNHDDNNNNNDNNTDNNKQ